MQYSLEPLSFQEQKETGENNAQGNYGRSIAAYEAAHAAPTAENTENSEN